MLKEKTTEQYPAWAPCFHSQKYPVELEPTVLFYSMGRETHWTVLRSHRYLVMEMGHRQGVAWLNNTYTEEMDTFPSLPLIKSCHTIMGWVGQDLRVNFYEKPYSFWSRALPFCWAFVPSYTEMEHETSTLRRQSIKRTSEAEQEPNLSPTWPWPHQKASYYTSLKQAPLCYLQSKHLTSYNLKIHSDTTIQSFTSSEQKPMLDSHYWPEFQRRQLFNLGQLDIAQIALWNDI